MAGKASIGAHNAKVMNRFDLTKRLVGQLKREEAVIGGIGNANFDLWASGQRPQNFYMLGSMGLACPIALGVALAQPDRGVIALEGDGSILMSLGCLATIGKVAPRNLTIIIWDNGIYQITGKQPTATAGSTDIVAVARGAGQRMTQARAQEGRGLGGIRDLALPAEAGELGGAATAYGFDQRRVEIGREELER